MKKLFLLITVLLISCNGFFNSEQYEIVYAFENKDKVKQIDIDATKEVIKKRLRKYIRNVEVKSNSNKDIIVKLDEGFNLVSVNKVIENQGKLDFWPCVSKEKMFKFLMKMDSITKNDSLTKPFFSMVQNINPRGLPVFLSEDLKSLKALFHEDRIKALFIGDYEGFGLLFGLPCDGFVELYGIESYQKERAPVNETHITEARQD